jgi:hypothetical protein
MAISGGGTRLSEHFLASEFRCPCCGEARVSRRLVKLAEALRERLGRPILVTSGYRCRKHNREVGGAPASRHMAGRALDMAAAEAEQGKIAALAEAVGFSEIIKGREKGYVHLGC